MRLLRILAGTLLLGPASAGEASPPPSEVRRLPEIRETGCHFLWRVEKDGKQAFLLGSLHTAPADLYPLPAGVLGAYALSQALALEVHSDDPQAALRAQAAMMESGKYPEGETLKGHLPEDLWKRLQAFCKERKLPFKKMQEYRPWCVASFVENRELAELDAREQSGIENFFVPLARKDGKPIRALEKMEAHFRAPFVGDAGVEAALVEQVLGEGSAFPMKDVLDWTLKAWRAGDAEAFCAYTVGEQARRYPGLAPHLKHMVTDRNAVMADSIARFVESGETVFCLAGMMHCGGEDGVPALLRRRGFTVTQVEKRPPAK